MFHYPNQPLSFTKVMAHSVKLHYLTLKRTILPIFLILIVKHMATLLEQFILNPWAQLVIEVAMWFLFFCFFSMALLAAHLAFTDRAESIRKVCKTWLSRWSSILLTVAVYVIGTYLLYALMEFIVYLVSQHVPAQSTLRTVTAIFCVAVLIMYVAMFAFTVPLSVLDGKLLRQSFQDSMILTEKNRLGVIMLFVILAAIASLVSPAATHEYLLSTYHLDVVFDFMVFCITIPLLINVLLLLLNDSKQKAVGEI